MKKCNHILFRQLGFLVIGFLCAFNSAAQQASDRPLRLAVAGITHGHTTWILDKYLAGKQDIKVVGIFESNQELAKKLADQYKLAPELFFTNLEKMLDVVKPEAVTAFGSIYEHMAVVEACAPRGIHVMFEKPLATNVAHAYRMKALAQKYNVHLVTNYETSWYPSNAKVYQLVNDSNYMGKIRKAVIHDGHEGPKEIGAGEEFLEWLTDSVQNGGGALIDFGCYGANLMTWLMQNEEPVSVTAVTRRYKPGIYSEVDDDATIIVNYPTAQCIIQASWNWPFGRKDMEIYGETGYAIAIDNTQVRIRNKQSGGEKTIRVTTADIPVYDDPVAYFADVIRSEIKMPVKGTYSLENNVWVVRILDAARQSARTGKTVYFDK